MTENELLQIFPSFGKALASEMVKVGSVRIRQAWLLPGNKHFGISANLRHACAACFPANLPFFSTTGKRSLEFVFCGRHFMGALFATF